MLLTPECVAVIRSYVPLLTRARNAGLVHCTYGISNLTDIEHTWESGGRWDGVKVSLFCGQLEMRVNSSDPAKRVRLSVDEGLNPARATALADAVGAVA
jgi:hypothetical protein